MNQTNPTQIFSLRANLTRLNPILDPEGPANWKQVKLGSNRVY